MTMATWPAPEDSERDECPLEMDYYGEAPDPVETPRFCVSLAWCVFGIVLVATAGLLLVALWRM